MRMKSELLALVAAAFAISCAGYASGTDKEGGPVTESELNMNNSFSELWVRVVVKTWVDEQFKQELLADPAKALEEHFDYKVPPGERLEIVEGRPEAPAEYKFTLPTMHDIAEARRDWLASDVSDPWFRVTVKAWTDEKFKQELLTTPAKALKEHFEYEVPPNVRLLVEERKPDRPAEYKLTLPKRGEEILGLDGALGLFC
ncbi:hypothetical protein [Polyangium sp. y55x31]|uniref:hypothetical protein n=1 Tax=Polyangium sp. y55x31 TaxID=3042688 RepID=UPI0024826E3F|nr:hypothetical protein [Polyangium sp. y55x31]MDI1480351.1 hypothetical protein [Polyangium sp. y55x31]